jgi:hypothetical protein
MGGGELIVPTILAPDAAIAVFATAAPRVNAEPSSERPRSPVAMSHDFQQRTSSHVEIVSLPTVETHVFRDGTENSKIASCGD